MRILDIGCFDGRLLVELDRIITNADLWGFDINPYLELVFPQKDNFHFVSADLNKAPGQFDLITLSHSIILIPDLNELMTSISHLLQDDGIMFVQLPDISKNPYYSLMGDQSFIFTETSLINVLSKFGFRGEVINNAYFPRELLFAVQKDESVRTGKYQADNLFEKNIETLNHVKTQLENMNHPNLTVLGTTVNAAFVDEILGGSIDSFVDENLSKIGKVFRGKNVIHPKDLNNNSHTILPYGKSGIKIQERFENLYKGTFTVI